MALKERQLQPREGPLQKGLGPVQEEPAPTVLRRASERTPRCSPLQNLNVQASGWCVALLEGHLGLVPYLF